MTTQTLGRLASTFTVRDVMVPRSRLVCGASTQDCIHLLDANPEYNLIPLLEGDRLTGYVDRVAGEDTIRLDRDVISDSTSLLHLIDLLVGRSFCFVLVGYQVEGYVHFSDLNNRLVELSLYVLLQAVEHHLVGLLGSLPLDEVVSVLGAKRARLLEGLFKHLAETNADLDLLSVMQLKDYLRLANHRGTIGGGEEEINRIYGVRNSVSHARTPLVRAHRDVKDVAWVKNYCMDLLAEGASL